ncbi:MAG: response regulator [Gemmatimonadetes bacterium]|nr:response regulator [Gemmatimonadota bacterium]
MSASRKGRKGWKGVLAASPSNATVLVVEDEAAVRRAMEKLVASFGHEVKVAASAEEADHWLNAMTFDAMILDIQLPRMSGVEFLDWALERQPELAVLMLTGLDEPEMAVRCIEHGARTYLVKPVEAEFLRLALRDALAVQRLLVERNDLV